MKYAISILVFLAVVTVGVLSVLAFRPSRPSPQAAKKNIVLTDYIASDAQVSLTTAGKIVAEENHREIRITVSRNKRTLEIFRGYQGSVESTHTLSNTQAAYDDFLNALNVAGFARFKTDSKQTVETGMCPTGQRFIYELRENQNNLLRTWSSSCRNMGNFSGNSQLTQQLMRSQIPDYDKLTRGVRL